MSTRNNLPDGVLDTLDDCIETLEFVACGLEGVDVPGAINVISRIIADLQTQRQRLGGES